MKTDQKRVIVVGGGPAGLVAASNLALLGYNVTILEKEAELGGKIRKWHKLFPDGRPAQEVVNLLNNKMTSTIRIVTEATINNIIRENGEYVFKVNNNSLYSADAVLLTVGYDLFDARRKEEYGYGIYDNVITSAELECIFSDELPIRTKQNKKPGKIAFIHCVGSRDEKVGHEYCSSVCCVTGVKQAIEVKKQLPDSEIFMLYMDLRMYGRFFEDMYLEAQEKYHVQFIRGRLSEAAENPDGSLTLRADDTLAGNPLKLNVDMMVLLIGMEAPACTKQLSRMLKVETGSDGFFIPSDAHTESNSGCPDGVFIAGNCTGPKSLEFTIADARSAALKLHKYLVATPVAKMLN
jgi:heterodisulfide reductase subunit A2